MTKLSDLKISSNQVDRASSDGVLMEMALRPGDAPELTFGKFVIDPGVSLPAHQHAADTIAYCVTGSCSFRVGEQLDEEFTIGPGEYCYIPAGVLHTEETGEDGAELICVMANWPEVRSEHWVRLLQARAIENQAYVIGVNRCGADPEIKYDGRTCGFDPHGQLLGELDGSQQTAHWTIDAQAVRQWREQFPALRDIRS